MSSRGNVRDVAGHRLVYVVESPFSERDAHRFGVRLFQSLNRDVEVWEVGSLTLPKSDLQQATRPVDVSIRRVERIAELQAMCAELQQGDWVLPLLGVYVREFQRCSAVLRALCASPAFLGGVSGIEPWNTFDLSPAFAREYPPVEFALRLARDRLAGAVLRSLSRVLNMPGVRAFRRHRYGFRPLDRIWTATSLAMIDPIFVGARTVTSFLHAWDLDRVMEIEPPSATEGDCIVYIDGLGPLHPDSVTLGLEVELPSVEEYFAPKRACFDWIEERTGLPVVIAAHPRAPGGGVLEGLYGHRAVVYQATAEAIARSSLVLMSHPSTAVTLAAALRKPVVVMTCDADHRYQQWGQRQLAKALHLDTLSVDRLPTSFGVPAIDVAAYSRFFTSFIKRPGTSQGSFWNLVAAHIDTAGTQ